MKSYSVDRRMKGDGVHFYVRFKDEDTGKYGTAKSVDVLGRKLGLSKTHVTKLPIANQIAIKAQEVGLDGNEKMDDPLFIDFLKAFWDYYSSKYVKRENKKRADSIHRDHCYNMAGCIKNHVAPYLPKGLKCSQVKKKHMSSFSGVKDARIERVCSVMWI